MKSPDWSKQKCMLFALLKWSRLIYLHVRAIACPQRSTIAVRGRGIGKWRNSRDVFHWSLRSGSGTILCRSIASTTLAKTRETYCANAYISDYPHHWSKFPLMVSIICKQLDCREGTQSALSWLACVPIVLIPYSGKFLRFSRAEQLTHK